jgi:Flp pilus assembly protein CpaB
MRQGRIVIFVILGILIIISLGGVGLLWFLSNQKPATPAPGPAGGPTEAAVIEVTPTPESVNILAAGQTLERGIVIPTEAIVSVPWPKNEVPFSAITDTSQVVGYRARITIARGEPIFNTMVLGGLGTPENPFSPIGSDAALQIPTGLVAISMPYDPHNGVAMAVKDGDHVTVIASWRIVNLDSDWQSALPNQLGTLKVPKPGGQPGDTMEIGGTGPLGRLTPVPGSDNTTYVVASEVQRGRLVTQVVIKDALVLHMGYFGPNAALVVVPTDTPDPKATPPTAAPPTATPLPPRILTLVVSPQDALAINYINRMAEQYPEAMQVTLALRSAGDTSLTTTQSVTQQYMFENFDMQVPTKLDYGLWGTPVAPTAVSPAP